MQLFTYSWKLPAYSGAFLLTVVFQSFFAYNFAYNFNFPKGRNLEKKTISLEI